MGKHVNCQRCGKEHYASFAACPWCPQEEVSPSQTGESDSLTQTGERDSLAAGSGSGKYPEPGTTDWTNSGHPDHEPPH